MKCKRRLHIKPASDEFSAGGLKSRELLKEFFEKDMEGIVGLMTA
jgi:hypothetical protein